MWAIQLWFTHMLIFHMWVSILWVIRESPKPIDDFALVITYALSREIAICLQFLDGGADELKLDSDHVMVMGHSAGGYISSCLTLMDRERQKIKIKGAILDYPPLRQEVDTELRKVADPSKAISENRMLQYNNWYYNSFDELDDILASPLLADLHDLPKTLVISAEYDALKNEEKAYADKMREAGGDVEYYEFKNCRHGFTHECFNEYMPKESCEAWNLMSYFIKKVMASYED